MVIPCQINQGFNMNFSVSSSPSDFKTLWYVSLIGLLLCVGGEVLRKVSMLTAGRSFNHYIQTTRARDHVLVTHGVYAWSRHPAYVGWFYWSLGTQVCLKKTKNLSLHYTISYTIIVNSTIQCQ